jgi:hypothetical protein
MIITLRSFGNLNLIGVSGRHTKQDAGFEASRIQQHVWIMDEINMKA